MSVVIGLVVGFLAVRFVRLAAHELLDSVVLRRPNYRERYLPVAGGVLMAAALVLVEGGRVLLGALGLGEAEGTTAARVLVLLAVVGYALLGLVDDLVGDRRQQGFLGHGRALLRGELTTGGVKLIAGGALAFALVSAAARDDAARLVLDGLLVALAANLANLLDRRPGRAIKAAAAAYLPLLVVAGTGAAGIAAAPFMGCALGLLPDDLRERLMLGDAGANALGAGLGLVAVLTVGPDARTITLVAVAALNVVAELVSFTAVIERVPALRRIDEWGRADVDRFPDLRPPEEPPDIGM